MNLKVKNNQTTFNKITWSLSKNKKNSTKKQKFKSLFFKKPNSVFVISNNTGIKFITTTDKILGGILVCEIY